MSENENVIQETNENETPDYNEIINNCVGFDEEDNPKAAFSIETGTYVSKEDVIRISGNISYYNPQINITRTGEAVILDFIYANKTDSEFRAFWSLISKYGREFERAMQNNSPDIPVFRITIVPTIYAGRHCIIGIAPLYWALQPETPTSDINTLRVVFNLDSIAFAESEGYNLDELEASAEREEMQRDYIENAVALKEEENAEYREERDRMIEELRKEGQDY